jgi:hypothetical protein
MIYLTEVYYLGKNSIVITANDDDLYTSAVNWDLYITKDNGNYTLRYYNFKYNDGIKENSYRSSGIIEANSPVSQHFKKMHDKLNNKDCSNIFIYSDDKATFDLDKANVMKISKIGVGKAFFISMDKYNELFIDHDRRKNSGMIKDYKQYLAIKELYEDLKSIAKYKPNDITFFDFESKYEIDEYETMYQRSNYGKQDEKKDQFFHQLRLTKRNINK